MARDLGIGKASAASAKLGALPPQRAAAVLEAGYDYLTYRRASGERDVADPQALAHELLLERSRIDQPSQAPRIEPGARPDQGHGTARAVAGFGRRAGEAFQEIGYRPTYHDVLDDDAGYVRGAQIEFFDMRIRHYQRLGARLERFTPIDIFSAAPRDEFLHPKSWGVSAGWRRAFLRKGGEPLVAALDGQVGGAWRLGDAGLVYGMAQASARAHHDLQHGFALGAGPRIGALLDPRPGWRVHLYAESVEDFAGERDRPASIGLQGRWTLARDAALTLELDRHRDAGRKFSSALLSLRLYF